MKKKESKYIFQKDVILIQEKLSGANLQLFNILLKTGIRLGEIERYVFAVQVELLKSSKSETIILVPQKQNYKRLLPILPIDKISKISTNKNSIRDRIKRWELNFSAHDCRTTFITRCLNKGVQPHEVQKVVGHKNVETTLRYWRINTEQDLWIYDIAFENIFEYGSKEILDDKQEINRLRILLAKEISRNKQLIKILDLRGK